MNNESECFTGISKHEKTMYENVFIHCFRVFEYPGETRARVVYMASQMNRDVTECFRLLI
jgi:aspartyl/asparaginyl-tRNA synthetase